MNTKAMEWAFSTPRSLGGEARLLLLALAYDAKGTQVFPSGTVLATRTGMEPTELGVQVNSLKNLEFLRVEMHGDDRQLHLAMPAKGMKKLKETPAIPAEALQAALDYWNAMAIRTHDGNPAHKLATVRQLTADMKTKLAVRLAETGMESWGLAVDAIEKNAHCRGVNDRKWRADFHYLLQAKGYGKTINGGWRADYEELTNGGERTGVGGRGDKRQDDLRSTFALFGGPVAGRDGRSGRDQEARGAPRAIGRSPGKAGPGPEDSRPD